MFVFLLLCRVSDTFGALFSSLAGLLGLRLIPGFKFGLPGSGPPGFGPLGSGLGLPGLELSDVGLPGIGMYSLLFRSSSLLYFASVILRADLC